MELSATTIVTNHARVYKALEYLIADLDYDHYKSIRCGEDDGEDHFDELVDGFIRDLL